MFQHVAKQPLEEGGNFLLFIPKVIIINIYGWAEVHWESLRFSQLGSK